MNGTSREKLIGLVGLAAIAMFAIGCGAVESGTVMEVSEDSMTVADETSFTHTTYKVSPDASVQKDGQPAALADVEEGDDVSVTIAKDPDGNTIATAVSAESKPAPDWDGSERDAATDEQPNQDPLFVPGALDDADPDASPTMSYQGEITAIDEHRLTLSDPAGTQLAFVIDDQTKIIVNGEPAALDLLKIGFVAVVTARQDVGELVALEIDVAAPASTGAADDRPGTENEAPAREGPQF